jgi:hypothetical protein
VTLTRRSVNLVAAGSTLQSANAASIARHQGRGYIAAESKLSTIGNVVPWPHTTDSNGVAFPAGLLGVSWSDFYSTSETLFNTGLIAVPDTLPSGYVARNIREHQRGVGQSMQRGQFAPFTFDASGARDVGVGWVLSGTASPQAPRIRGSSALHPYHWFPENLATAAATYTDSTGSGSTTKLTGIRYARVTMPSLPFSPSTGTDRFPKARWRIGRMTDGDYPAFPGDYDANGLVQLDDTWFLSPELTAADMPYDSGVLVHDGATYDFHCPDGDRGYVWFAVEYYEPPVGATPGYWTSIYSSTYVGYFRARYGPRLDIPFPFLVTGESNRVAPGGILTGYVPGW